MSDLISRQALCEYALNQKNKSVTPNDIMRLPPAQPEKHTENTRKTHGVCLDAIDRQAAIDAMKSLSDSICEQQAIDALCELPSAQPVITCDGCRFVSTYDTDFPCCSCVRREKDYYAPER